MGTWMIHFLWPELKSQHLGKIETLATGPSCAHTQPIEVPELFCFDIIC
jgi:hypothetical protein